MTTPTRQLSDACFFTWLADLSLEEPGLGSEFSLRALTLPRVGLPEGGHVGRAFPNVRATLFFCAASCWTSSHVTAGKLTAGTGSMALWELLVSPTQLTCGGRAHGLTRSNCGDVPSLADARLPAFSSPAWLVDI